MNIDTCREIAARIWCDPAYGHAVFDGALCEDIAWMLLRAATGGGPLFPPPTGATRDLPDIGGPQLTIPHPVNHYFPAFGSKYVPSADNPDLVMSFGDAVPATFPVNKYATVKPSAERNPTESTRLTVETLEGKRYAFTGLPPNLRSVGVARDWVLSAQPPHMCGEITALNLFGPRNYLTLEGCCDGMPPTMLDVRYPNPPWTPAETEQQAAGRRHHAAAEYPLPVALYGMKLSVNETPKPRPQPRVLCSNGCCLECPACSAKPGMPELCADCLSRRRHCSANHRPSVVHGPTTIDLNTMDVVPNPQFKETMGQPELVQHIDLDAESGSPLVHGSGPRGVLVLADSYARASAYICDKITPTGWRYVRDVQSVAGIHPAVAYAVGPPTDPAVLQLIDELRRVGFVIHEIPSGQ